jgi:RHS repeat-associated protein
LCTYNGLGDRLTQNGTQYVLDLNAGLTQVLNDGENSYMYGLGRISQTNTTIEYFLGDALGGVRQLSMTDGEITLAESYDPYGTVTFISGGGTSPFAFTGEQQDASGLTYLRARYYNPADGRFMSRDTWAGDYNSPLSLNRWMYVEGNPVNLTDPSGYITEKESTEANKIVKDLRVYRVFVRVDWGMAHFSSSYMNQPGVPFSTCAWKKGQWELAELRELKMGVRDLSRSMGGLNKFIFNLGYVDVYKYKMSHKAAGGKNYLKVNYDKHNLDRWTVVHELGHSWDAKNNWKWSEGLEIFTTALGPRTQPSVCDADQRLPGCNNAGYVYGGIPAAGSDKNFDAREDFAESLAAYVYPGKAHDRVKKYRYINNGIYKDFLYYSDYRTTDRWAYIDSLIRLSIHLQQQK